MRLLEKNILSPLLFLLFFTVCDGFAQSNKSYFPMGGVTRYSNGTYYFARSGRQYVTTGEVVLPSGEVISCKSDGKRCAQMLAQAARESIEMDGLQFADPSSFVGSVPVLDLVSQYEGELSELGEEKSGIYFLDYRTMEWKVMKFFKESHTRVMKSLRKKG